MSRDDGGSKETLDPQEREILLSISIMSHRCILTAMQYVYNATDIRTVRVPDEKWLKPRLQGLLKSEPLCPLKRDMGYCTYDTPHKMSIQ